MTKKKVIDKYEMGIYPRTLWVCKNVTNEDINKKFEVKDPTKIDVSYTFAWMCIDKKNRKLWIYSKYFRLYFETKGHV